MAHLIDKDAVIAEIESIKSGLCNSFSDKWVCASLDNILSFLDTFEVKETNNIWYDVRKTVPEDSTEQIICVKDDGLGIVTVGKIVNGTVKWAYLNNLLKLPFNIEVKEVDLEKELIEWHKKHFKKDGTFTCMSGFYLTNNSQIDIARHFFELGLKVQKRE